MNFPYFFPCKNHNLFLINNKYSIQIFINLLDFINDSPENILEYEGHILLIIKIIYQIY